MNKIYFLLIAVTICVFNLVLNFNETEAAYDYYRTITVTSTDTVASGTLSNFPMLINIPSSSYLQDTSTGGRVKNASGYDIIFATSTSCATPMNFEREKYSSSTGELIAWVNVSSMTAGATIYMCYGDSSITNDQSSSTATWNSDYKAVWHMGETVTSTSAYILDSTANGNNASSTGASYPTASSTGKIGGAQDFDGSNDFLAVGAPASLADLAPLSISEWVLQDNLGFLIVKGGCAGAAGWCFISQGTKYYTYYRFSGGSNANHFTGNNTFASSTWTHLVVATDGSGTGANMRIYINGQEATYQLTNNVATPLDSDAASTISIGAKTASGLNPNNSTIDELRISNADLSSAWIITEYNNQSSPSTFYEIGTEVASYVPGGSSSPKSPPTVSFYAGETVLQLGASTTLSWVAHNTHSCYLNGIPVDSSASMSTGQIYATTIFKLSCYGIAGSIASTLVVSIHQEGLVTTVRSVQIDPVSSATPVSDARVPAKETSPDNYSGSFSFGGKISTNANLWVRTFPGLFGRNIKIQPNGTEGVLIVGPLVLDGYSWWYLKYADDTLGWSAGEFMNIKE